MHSSCKEVCCDRYAPGSALDKRIELRWCRELALSWQDIRVVLRQVGQVNAVLTNLSPSYDGCWWGSLVGCKCGGCVRSGALARNRGAACVFAFTAAGLDCPSPYFLASACALGCFICGTSVFHRHTCPCEAWMSLVPYPDGSACFSEFVSPLCSGMRDSALARPISSGMRLFRDSAGWMRLSRLNLGTI
jgi:hypothetical protein